MKHTTLIKMCIVFAAMASMGCSMWAEQLPHPSLTGGMPLMEAMSKRCSQRDIDPHPIVGDYKYGSQVDGAKRMCLHAFRLAFHHPVSGEALHFETPFPSYFLSFFKPQKGKRPSGGAISTLKKCE